MSWLKGWIHEQKHTKEGEQQNNQGQLFHLSDLNVQTNLLIVVYFHFRSINLCVEDYTLTHMYFSFVCIYTSVCQFELVQFHLFIQSPIVCRSPKRNVVGASEKMPHKSVINHQAQGLYPQTMGCLTMTILCFIFWCYFLQTWKNMKDLNVF